MLALLDGFRAQRCGSFNLKTDLEYGTPGRCQMKGELEKRHRAILIGGCALSSSMFRGNLYSDAPHRPHLRRRQPARHRALRYNAAKRTNMHYHLCQHHEGHNNTRDSMLCEVVCLLRDIKHGLMDCGDVNRSLNFHQVEFHGRIPMSTEHAPPLKLFDAEQDVVAISPRKRDGTIDTSLTPTWTSSDPSVVVVPNDAFDFDDGPRGIVHMPAGYQATIQTPNPSGSGLVTVSTGGGYNDADIQVDYVTGRPGSLNLSAGDPTLDTP